MVLSWYYVAMTEKQNKALDYIASGATPTQAMRRAGYSEMSSRTPKLLTRSKKVRTELEKALNKNNINIDRIAKTINEAFGATKVVITGPKDDAFAEVIPDHAIRLKAADMSIKLLPKTEKPKDEKIPEFDNEMIKDLLASGNLVELQRIMLSKDPS